MGAPKGNKYAKNNKGGSRKSAYQEKADAEALWEMYKNPQDINKLERKIKKGQFSIKERQMLLGLLGNERTISDIFKKLYPDNIDIKSDGEKVEGIVMVVETKEDGNKISSNT